MSKVIVGMSGGVDSSVAAYLLKEQGHDVVGVTMQIWQDDDNTNAGAEDGCCGLSAADDARRVATKLDIPHYVMNFRDEFKDKVIDYFVDEYLNGRTPNPCIACNRYVKWESLLERSMNIGGDYIATGHYARIERLENGRYTIKNSVSLEKDQTYALYNLTQKQLSKTLMPCGSYSKEEIREIAGKIDLVIANKPDSQDICFVPDGDYASFIKAEVSKTYKALEPGNFVNQQGDILGQHKGIVHYTVGQRKGLGLALGKPVYVLAIKPDTNEVVVGTCEESFRTTLKANQINFMSIDDLDTPKRVFGKIRYNHKGAWCTVEKTGPDEITCVFEEPQKGITPGQSVVLYDGGYILGGGVIC